MKCIPSPNFNARAANITLDYIVLHYTGMKSAEAALARLCDPAAEVSAHYLIDEDGTVTHLVDEKYRAWHAGKSFWRGIADINSASIGIELVNPGHEHGYCAFPAIQITALKDLLRAIIVRHDMIPATALLAHSDIAPARKEDPGELFPWQDLTQSGLGLWPVPQARDYRALSEAEIRVLFDTIGYDTNALDKTILAFQRRYYPEQLTGQADAETMARLQALSRMIG